MTVAVRSPRTAVPAELALVDALALAAEIRAAAAAASRVHDLQPRG